MAITLVARAPRIPAMGIYPTAESLGAQALLVGLAIVALAWTFFFEPRRLRVTKMPGPEDRPASRSRGAGGTEEPGPQDRGISRSSDPIEADLADGRKRP